jgi:hypothetical protein
VSRRLLLVAKLVFSYPIWGESEHQGSFSTRWGLLRSPYAASCNLDGLGAFWSRFRLIRGNKGTTISASGA